MGLIYSKSESDALIQALQSNLAGGKETIKQLKTGSQLIVEAVDGDMLSEAAYTAGQGLFSELIIPTILQTTSAWDKIERELQTFMYANEAISDEVYLDEDNLNQQIAVKKAMIASIEFAYSAAKANAISNPVDAVQSAVRNYQKKLEHMSLNIQNDIEYLQRKIEKLQEFSYQTNGLFSTSLNNLNIAMQKVLTLNETSVNLDGTYLLPEGIDNVWLNNDYTYYNVSSDFSGKITSVSEWVTESLGAALNKIHEIAIIKGKNIGRVIAAKLQPRSTLGTFVKDDFLPRKWVTSKLRTVSNSTSKAVGIFAKWGGRALIGLGFYLEFKDYYNETGNVGRAISYSGAVTSAGYAGGAIGAAVGAGVAKLAISSIAVIKTGSAVAAALTFALPVALAVAVGAAAVIGANYMYINFDPFRDLVDGVGDAKNNVGNKILELGNAYVNTLKSFNGAFL